MVCVEVWYRCAIRVIVGVVFVVSAVFKSVSPDSFLLAVEDVNIFWQPLTKVFAYGLILFELALGLLLVFSKKRVVLKLAIFTIVIFVFYLIFRITRGEVSDCGCFGSVIQRTSIDALVQDMIMLSMLVIALDEDGGRKRL